MQWNDTNRIARVSSFDYILSVGRRHQALHSGITVTVWISIRRGADIRGRRQSTSWDGPETADPRLGLVFAHFAERNDGTTTHIMTCMSMSDVQFHIRFRFWG